MRRLLFLVLSAVLAAPEDLNSTLMAIKRLHEGTGYSTFYEVFGASERTSMATIRKMYQKMMRSPSPIAGVKSRDEAVVLLTEAYNILRNNKATYDFILANSYLYLGAQENFRNNPYVILLSAVAAALAIDLLLFAVKYLAFVATPRKAPKRRGAKTPKDSMPSMMVVNLFWSARSLIKKQ